MPARKPMIRKWIKRGGTGTRTSHLNMWCQGQLNSYTQHHSRWSAFLSTSHHPGFQVSYTDTGYTQSFPSYPWLIFCWNSTSSASGHYWPKTPTCKALLKACSSQGKEWGSTNTPASCECATLRGGSQWGRGLLRWAPCFHFKHFSLQIQGNEKQSLAKRHLKGLFSEKRDLALFGWAWAEVPILRVYGKDRIRLEFTL